MVEFFLMVVFLIYKKFISLYLSLAGEKKKETNFWPVYYGTGTDILEN